MDPENPHGAEWVQTLSDDQLRVELERRGQRTGGTTSALRARLIKYESCAQLGWEVPLTPTGLDPEIDALPEGSPMRSGEGGERAVAAGGSVEVDRTRLHLRPPRIELPSRGENRPFSRSTSSVMDAYHMMRRWNLQFSGARGSDAETFLTRIEEGRALITVSDEEIFKCIPFFLSGIALYWYRSERNRWRTWRDFEAAWRARFGNPDFQFALRDEIMRRTQGEHESIADFITCIRALFDRLSPPWSLEEQLNYAHRNMLPRLQISVPRRTVYDFASLEDAAMRIERSYEALTQYRAPPAPEQSIFPDLAYRPPRKAAKGSIAVAAAGITGVSSGKKKKSEKRSGGGATGAPAASTTTAVSSIPTSASTSTAAASSSTSTARKVKCWNCEKIGHIARECSESRRQYCYRCGKANVTVKTCPSCSGNEAESR